MIAVGLCCFVCVMLHGNWRVLVATDKWAHSKPTSRRSQVRTHVKYCTAQLHIPFCGSGIYLLLMYMYFDAGGISVFYSAFVST